MSVAKTLCLRMKEYEVVTKNSLIKRQPVIIRLDGRAFHSFTRGLDKPFDIDFNDAMKYTCMKMKDKVQNTKLIYSQSDEISFLLTDWDDLNTDCWFNNTIQKIVSVSASMATMYFNEYVEQICEKYFRLYNTKDIDYEDEQKYLKKYQLWKSKKYKAQFDARAFNLPCTEVCNYFIYRQKDAIRNSKQSLAQAYFSQKQLQNKSNEIQVEMVREGYDIDWNNLSSLQQQGFCIYKDNNLEEKKWVVDIDIPDFMIDRNYVDKFIQFE